MPNYDYPNKGPANDGANPSGPAVGFTERLFNPYMWGENKGATVYVDPASGFIVETSDPFKIAELTSRGYRRVTYSGPELARIRLEAGDRYQTPDSPDSYGNFSETPTLSQADLEAIKAAEGKVDANAEAQGKNLLTAFQLAQPGRDRQALQTKEAYEGGILPTLAAGAFGGAGYHQPLNQIYLDSIDRDRRLADIEDANKGADFSFQGGIADIAALRESQRNEIYAAANRREQELFDSRAGSILDWVNTL